MQPDYIKQQHVYMEGTYQHLGFAANPSRMVVRQTRTYERMIAFNNTKKQTKHCINE